MADVPDTIRGVAHGTWGKPHGGGLPGGCLPRGGWKTVVDPLYIWSAAVGLFVALVLIAVARVMQTGHLR